MRTTAAGMAIATSLIAACASKPGTGGAAPGCQIAAVAACDPEATAETFVCAPGQAPPAGDAGLECTLAGTDSNGNGEYCCSPPCGAGGTICTEDDLVTSGCAHGSLGYQCTEPGDPSSLDSTLMCAPGFPDTACPNLTDFCCTVGAGDGDGGAG